MSASCIKKNLNLRGTSMKVGKVPENVLKRAVFKQITNKREEVLLGAGVGEDCAALKLKEDEIFVLSTDPITGTTQDIGNLAVLITSNDLASAGAEPVGVLLTILLPENTREAALKRVMEDIQVACKKENIQIMGGHTEVTKAVNQILVSVTGVGKVKEGRMVSTAGAKPGMDLIVTKSIALEGTSIIAKEKEEELKKHYPEKMVEKAKGFDQYLSVSKEGLLAAEIGVGAMHDVTEGGIFGALWEIAESSGVGLEVDLMKIPVKQETIEICNYFDINPYQLISSGSMLIAANGGTNLVQKLAQEGIEATIIGCVVEGNDRIIVNGEERRYLEPPKEDELYKVV